MKIGFDNAKYLKIQSEHIKDRIGQFGNKLYLEFSRIPGTAGLCTGQQASDAYAALRYGGDCGRYQRKGYREE